MSWSLRDTKCRSFRGGNAQSINRTNWRLRPGHLFHESGRPGQGPIMLSEFKAVMLASLRSLVPKARALVQLKKSWAAWGWPATFETTGGPIRHVSTGFRQVLLVNAGEAARHAFRSIAFSADSLCQDWDSAHEVAWNWFWENVATWRNHLVKLCKLHKEVKGALKNFCQHLCMYIPGASRRPQPTPQDFGWGYPAKFVRR